MGGKTETTERSRTDPAKWLRPHIDAALQGAGNLYDKGAPTYAGFSPVTETALEGYAAGSPLVGGAQDMLGDTLSGQYLSPESNPYLSRAYDLAADKMRGHVNAEFSKAGRYGSGAHQGKLQEGLGNLATSFYAPAYEAERGRQFGAAQMAPGLGFANLDRMYGAGQARDIKAEQEVNDPYEQIRRYVSIIGGVPQGTESYGKTTQQYKPGALDIIGGLGSIAAIPLSGGTSLLGSLLGGMGGAAGGAAGLTAGTWASDRNLKTDIKPADGEEALEKFRKLPVSDYRYKDEAREVMSLPEQRTGPMAQDYARVFRGDGKTIDIGDALGNAIAAIKALDERTRRPALSFGRA